MDQPHEPNPLKRPFSALNVQSEPSESSATIFEEAALHPPSLRTVTASTRLVCAPAKVECTSGDPNCYCRSGRSRAVCHIDASGDTLAVFCSGMDAAKKLRVKNTEISAVCCGRRAHTTSGHIFRFHDGGTRVLPSTPRSAPTRTPPKTPQSSGMSVPPMPKLFKVAASDPLEDDRFQAIDPLHWGLPAIGQTVTDVTPPNFEECSSSSSASCAPPLVATVDIPLGDDGDIFHALVHWSFSCAPSETTGIPSDFESPEDAAIRLARIFGLGKSEMLKAAATLRTQLDAHLEMHEQASPPSKYTGARAPGKPAFRRRAMAQGGSSTLSESIRGKAPLSAVQLRALSQKAMTATPPATSENDKISSENVASVLNEEGPGLDNINKQQALERVERENDPKLGINCEEVEVETEQRFFVFNPRSSKESNAPTNKSDNRTRRTEKSMKQAEEFDNQTKRTVKPVKQAEEDRTVAVAPAFKFVAPPPLIDGNVDVCGQCSTGGDLLCCDFCPRAFHTTCLGVDEESLPEGDWACSFCAEEQARLAAKKSRWPLPERAAVADAPTYAEGHDGGAIQHSSNDKAGEQDVDDWHRAAADAAVAEARTTHNAA